MNVKDKLIISIQEAIEMEEEEIKINTQRIKNCENEIRLSKESIEKMQAEIDRLKDVGGNNVAIIPRQLIFAY